jgi:ABC-type multidrug transport system fused ATPase/permease subunit
MARDRPPPDAIDDVAVVPITTEGLREAARLFSYVRPHRRKLVAGHVCLLVSTLAGLAFPYFTGRLIDAAQRDVRVTALTSQLPAGSLDVNTIALVLLLALAVQAFCSYFQTYWLTEVAERSLADLRRDVYGHLICLPMTFFAQRRVGELASRLATDLAMIQGTLTGTIPMLLSHFVVLAGGLTLITLTSGRLTLVMISSLPVAIGVATIFGRRTHRVAHEAQDKLADTNVIVEETLQGIASVKAFTNEGYETARYRAGVGAMIDVALRGARYQGAFGAFITFVLFGSIIPTMWYGARLVESGALTFGGMTQFLIYTIYLGGSMGQFARQYGEWHRTMGATQRVRELLTEAPEALDGRCAGETGTALESDGLPAPIVGDVSFERVSFSYPSRKGVTVLRDLSLTVEAGRRIALVGPSGAGKSTIVSLLLRFYDPDAGRIRIDGRDARDYPLHLLRSRMAIVPQDVLLFGGTIAENIAYGRLGATASEIEDSARQANAHDFITGFPEGYQTLVGDRGVKLSGGQRQRVAIARAILRDPAILILDEATSSLDSESESLVQQALDTLMRGRTSVIIAHRLATVRRAECIFVIKDGQVVESGTHEQLSARDWGLYRTLSELQFGLGEATPAPTSDA